MVTKVYNFYYAGTGNAAGLVNNLITQRGMITAVDLNFSQTPGANLNPASFELSFVNAVQAITNGVLGPIAGIQLFAAWTAAGSSMLTICKTLSGLMIPVNSGDTIYLNTSNANAVQLYCSAKLYVNQA